MINLNQRQTSPKSAANSSQKRKANKKNSNRSGKTVTAETAAESPVQKQAPILPPLQYDLKEEKL
jgi:hypothetical protein